MTTTELLAIFREEVADNAAPYLWSDALVYAYIDDAQKQFCRDTYGIEDARSFKITTVATTEWYAIDPKIMEIECLLDSRGEPIPVITMQEATKYGIRLDGATGTPKVFIKGMQKGYLRAYPVPSAAFAYAMQTRRIPEDVAAGDDFEVDSQHHLNLLMWVKYRAYSNQDADAVDPVKADDFKTRFAAYCDKSKTEQGRLNRNVAIVTFRGF